uniref:Uncharacterized protein n=1 Tax=Glossina pallidipes TaxID=7398 RepID=A0A1A9Z694_GLOPL
MCWLSGFYPLNYKIPWIAILDERDGEVEVFAKQNPHLRNIVKKCHNQCYIHRTGTSPSKNITFKCYAVIVKLARYGMTNTSFSSSNIFLIKFYDTLHAILPTYENAVN